MNKDRGVLLYKCRQCGVIIKNTYVPNALVALIKIINGDDLPWPGPLVSMISIHTCGDSRVGVTDLIGVESDKEE